MAVRSQPPTLMLYDFIISKREVSEADVEELRNKLSSYDEEHRRTIINTHLICSYERTLVHVTAAMNLAPFLEVLLENGGNPNVVSTMTDYKQTPLHLAAKYGCWKCIDLLLQYGANLYIENMRQSTPYDYIKDTPYYEKMMAERKQAIIQAMYEARKDCCAIKVRYGKVLLCGANAAGKTNFLNLLMKNKFNPKHVSTEVAKPHQATIVVKAQIIMHHEEVTFKIMNIDDEIDYLMLYLPKKYTKPSPRENAEREQGGAAKSQDQKIPTFVEDIMSRKLVLNKAPEQLSDEIWDLFTFIDTGGQPQFISMLPVVNVSSMITFIVHKMMKGGKEGLNQKFHIQHRNEKGERSFTQPKYECTYLQLIKTLISHASVNLLPDEGFNDYKLPDYRHPDSKKSISFIGTHSKDISESNINKIDKVLKETLDYNSKACLQNIRRELNTHYTYIIPVDSNKQSKSSSAHHKNPRKFTDVSKIRGYIYEYIQKQDVYTVPIQWLLLDLEIRKKCKNEEINFITYDDVLMLAREKNLGEGKFIKSALRFHHLHGVLLYFEDVEGMRELVITNHQWLFEKLTEIVLYTFKKDRNEEYLDLKEGIFRESMLNKLKIEKDFEKSRIDSTVINPTRSFIKLLQHLLIIAPLQEDGTKYFMPSLLRSCDITILQQIIPGDNHFKTLPDGSEPLLIQFEFIDKIDGFPRGFFCFLIVQLLHSGNWKLYKENAKHNLITFLISDHSAYYVTLIDKIFFLEVHVTHESSDMAPIHHEVFKTIERSLTVVGERLHIVIKIKVGFLCKKCQDTSEEHITYLPQNISEHRYCSCIAQKPTKIEKSHEAWLKVTPTVNESERVHQPAGVLEFTVEDTYIADLFEKYPRNMERLSLKPIYTELIELFKGVVSWQTLAAHLLSDKDGSKVKIIEENNHGNVQKCRAEMLQEYFKSGTVSWEVVLEALRKAGEKNTADKIKQKLL